MTDGEGTVTTRVLTDQARRDTPPRVELVWREFGASVQTFVRRRIADPHRADDVVGEILLRIHKSLHTMNDSDRLGGWVFRIARNAITDEYRRAARRHEDLDADAGADVASDDADVWGDDEAEVLSELAACMRPLLAQLPDHYRRALELTDLDGVTQAEAARREGISVSGMKSRVQRGRRQLQEILAACCALTLDARGFPVDFAVPTDCACS